MTSENKSPAKYFFIVVSVVAHAVLFYYIAYKAMDYSLPAGQVTSYEMTLGENPTTPTAISVRGRSTPKIPAVKYPALKAAATPDGTLPVKDAATSAVPEKTDLADDQKDSLQKQDDDAKPEDKTEDLPPVPVPAAAEEAPAPTPEPEQPLPPQEHVDAAPSEAPTAATASTGESIIPTQVSNPQGVQSDVVLTPVAGNAAITYPMMARLRKVEGETVVHYSVDGVGNVTNVDVVQSSGSNVLDGQVVSTIKSWKFKPTGQEGVYERPVKFSLKGEAQDALGKLRRGN